MHDVTKTLKMWQAAAYEVRLQGVPDATWAALYPTMNLTVDHATDGRATTTMVGLLKDQAHLIGLLVSLLDLGLPLLGVAYLPEPAPGAGGA